MDRHHDTRHQFGCRHHHPGYASRSCPRRHSQCRRKDVRPSQSHAMKLSLSPAGFAPLLVAAISVACLSLRSNAADETALSIQDFRNPPTEARPSALWTWLNGHVDLKQITRELEEMKAKGMRGAIIWDLGALSDPNKIIPGRSRVPRPGIAQGDPPCDGRGENGSGWNSASSPPAVGIPEEPGSRRKTRSKALLWSETEVKGRSEFSGILPLPEKAGGTFQGGRGSGRVRFGKQIGGNPRPDPARAISPRTAT